MLFEDAVLSPGKKLKKLRKELKLRQDDISEGINRSNVAVAEKTGRVSKRLAEIAIERFNKEINDKKLHYEGITLEWILEEERVQAYKLALKHCNNMQMATVSRNSNINTYVEQILELIEYDLKQENLAEIYDNISNAYFRVANYKECKVYALKEFNVAVKMNSVDYILSSIKNLVRAGYYSDYSGEYSDVFIYLNMAKELVEHDFSYYKATKIIFYYGALAYRKLDKLNECLNLIRIIEENFSLAQAEWFDIYTLKGICYMRSSLYAKARKIFFNVLEKAKETENFNVISLLYANLADLEIRQFNNFSESDKYIKLAVSAKVDSNYYTNIIYSCVISAIESSNNIFLNSYYRDAINSLCKAQEVDMQFELITNLFNYYLNNLMNKSVEDLLNILYNKFINNQIKDIRLILLFNVAYNHYSITNRKKAEKYIKDILKIKDILRL